MSESTNDNRAKLTLNSKRFGVIEVEKDRIINFEEGLLGFRSLKQFILVDDPAATDSPFRWLINIEDPEIGFVVTDPGIFFSDYVIEVSNKDREELGIEGEEDVTVISLLTIPENPKQITANLRGPLVVNWKAMKGRQIVLKEGGFTTKHFIFIQGGGEDSENERVSLKKMGTKDSNYISQANLSSEKGEHKEVNKQ